MIGRTLIAIGQDGNVDLNVSEIVLRFVEEEKGKDTKSTDKSWRKIGTDTRLSHEI
jgi:hypothetical protein